MRCCVFWPTRTVLLLSVKAEVTADRPTSVRLVSFVAECTAFDLSLCEAQCVDNVHRCTAFDQCAPGDTGPLKSEHDSHLKESCRADVMYLLFCTESKGTFSMKPLIIIILHIILCKLVMPHKAIIMCYKKILPNLKLLVKPVFLILITNIDLWILYSLIILYCITVNCNIY